ncbi:hypothetical protein ACIA49_28645 [Kribbella sp. NPDC051587]|uniref:hypothetical protein n=1 Tax=Kribbella sp. NPDC051587 TaxID=3364119 RepID=UPI0037B8F1DC
MGMNTDANIHIRHTVDEHQLAGLMKLFASAWWMTDRTLEETRLILRESALVVAVVDASSNRVLLVG